MVAISREPTQKKQKKQTMETVPPTWEKTRFFREDEPKAATALPTVQTDGKVVHQRAARPTFVAKAPPAKAAKPYNLPLKPLKPLKPTELVEDSTSTGASKAEHAADRRQPLLPAKRKRSSAASSGSNSRRALDGFAKRLDNFEQTKVTIASLASQIVANPHTNYAKLRDLRQMASELQGGSAALALLTEAQVYKDLAPSYRIRLVSDKEAETKVSKDVARLRAYEEALLRGYQRLVSACVVHSHWRAPASVDSPELRAKLRVRRAACTALAELVAALPHFNEAEKLVSAVCNLTMDRDEEVRANMSRALCTVLSDAHRASGYALHSCVQIARTLSGFVTAKARVMSLEAVEPLVCIHFTGFAKLPSSKKAKNEPKKAKRLSKTKRTKLKQGATEGVEKDGLEKDLDEANADATPQEMFTARKSMLDAVCHTYFNVLKAASGDAEKAKALSNGGSLKVKKPPPALSASLKGLLKICPFININIIEAILAALTPMLEVPRLPLSIRFRCLAVAYAILAISARVQQADPGSFTSDAKAMDSSLYAALAALYAPENPTKDDETRTFDAIEALIAASSFRTLPKARSAALARRLAMLTASSATTHASAIGLLCTAQKLMDPQLVAPIFPPRGEGNDGSVARTIGDDGLVQVFDMETDDPDIANAERSAAWELCSLLHHFHPTVRDVARKCSEGYCGSQYPRMAENIVLRAKRHESSKGGFNPPPQVAFQGPVSKQVVAGAQKRAESFMATFFNGPEETANFFSEDADDKCVSSFFEACWTQHSQDATT